MSIKLSWAMAIAMGSSSWLYRIANNIRTRTECKLYSIINNMGLLLRLQIQSACSMQLHASQPVCGKRIIHDRVSFKAIELCREKKEREIRGGFFKH